MAATWSLDSFADPREAKNFAACVSSSGGAVISIAYGPISASGMDMWLVFASFDEGFQMDECMLRWSESEQMPKIGVIAALSNLLEIAYREDVGDEAGDLIKKYIDEARFAYEATSGP